MAENEKVLVSVDDETEISIELLSKPTKKEVFAILADYLNENADDIIYNSLTNKGIKLDFAIDFCNSEIERLEKKANTPSKPTKTQEENVVIMQTILTVMAEKNVKMTISDMLKDGRLSNYTNQRISALVRKLKEDGKVIRTEEKKKAYFTLVKPTAEKPVEQPTAEQKK